MKTWFITGCSTGIGRGIAEAVLKKGDQPGDPMKAGQIIVETIEQEEYPRTLLLVSDAVEAVTKKLTNQLAEIEQYREISKKTDYRGDRTSI